MPLPLAAIVAPAAISAGASLLSGFLNKPSGAEKALTGETARKVKLEGNILQMRQEFLETLMGERDAFRKAIVDKKGQPLVMRLPGVGGISDEQWAKKLNEAMGAIDFGGKRAWDAGQQLLAQMSPGSNSIGAGAGMAQQMQAQRAKSTGATAGFLGDLGTSLFNHFMPGGGNVASGLAQGIAPMVAGSLLDGMSPPPLPAALQSAPAPAPMALSDFISVLPTGPQGGSL